MRSIARCVRGQAIAVGLGLTLAATQARAGGSTRGPLAGTRQGDNSTNSFNVLGFTVAHRF